jgi:hypothetical protein
MTGASTAVLRTLAFGDLNTGVWGVAAQTGSGASASFADSFDLDTDAERGEWLAAAGGLELRLNPTCEPAGFGPAQAGIDGFVQLCQVEGALHRDGAEQDVACLGIRGVITLPPLVAASARIAVGWLGPDSGFAVLALRPARAAGHDADLIACAIVHDGAALEIDDPRLSTTYAPSGLPVRAGLELWLVEHEPAEGEEAQPYYPRRIGGESAGDGSELAIAGLELRAELFRWRTKGHEGAGVYLLTPAP